MDDEPTVLIQEPSALALRLRMQFKGAELATGTGFLTVATAGPLLITARHNLTGRHQQTGECLHSRKGVPDEVVIRHNAADTLATYVEHVEPLYDGDKPLWFEHPTLGPKADIVALPLTRLDGIHQHINVFPFMPPLFLLIPGEQVSVVGYPFGEVGAGDLAIWSTGFIATEIDLHYGGLPQFLIDARTRRGQSGSPVFAHRFGWVRMRNRQPNLLNMPASDFLGVYSGRINEQSDIGVVWKAVAVAELINAVAIATGRAPASLDHLFKA